MNILSFLLPGLCVSHYTLSQKTYRLLFFFFLRAWIDFPVQLSIFFLNSIYEVRVAMVKVDFSVNKNFEVKSVGLSFSKSKSWDKDLSYGCLLGSWFRKLWYSSVVVSKGRWSSLCGILASQLLLWGPGA